MLVFLIQVVNLNWTYTLFHAPALNTTSDSE